MARKNRLLAGQSLPPSGRSATAGWADTGCRTVRCRKLAATRAYGKRNQRTRGGNMKRQLTGALRRSILTVAGLAAAAVLAVGLASPASAYGGGAGHDTWQVGISGNCNNPSFCGTELGGFWGWVEFDRFADGTITGDAQLTG